MDVRQGAKPEVTGKQGELRTQPKAPETEGPMARAVTIGTQNMVKCAQVTTGDRVAIITDRETLPISDKIKASAEAAGAKVGFVVMEDLGQRPLLALPPETEALITGLNPNKSFFAATCQEGELAFRKPLIGLLSGTFKTQHYHMPGITPEIAGSDAMCADFDEMYRLTHKVLNAVKEAKYIFVRAANGTNLSAEFSPEMRWQPDDGSIAPGTFGNLPAGEVFTTPLSVNGVLVTSVLGDHFCAKYGVLETPVMIKIENSRAVSVTCDNKELEAEVLAYLHQGENADRVGEFAIGTNTGITKLSGNMLMDEKAAGVHLAFGDPLGEHTGAKWSAQTHCDMVVQGCEINADGRIIMMEGRFVI